MIESNPAGDSAWADSGEDGLETVMADPHCRYLLEYLDDADGPVPLSAVAKHVVAGITDSDPDDVPPDVERRVMTWLHHGQLPELDERGFVNFDPDAGTVSLATDEFASVGRRT